MRRQPTGTLADLLHHAGLLLLAAGLPTLAACGDDAGTSDDGGADADAAPDADADATGEGGDTDAADTADSPDESLPPATITPAADLLPAADPKLDGFTSWPLGFDVDPAGRTGLRCRLVVTRGAETLATLDAVAGPRGCRFAWNGRDADGGFLPPGPLTAAASLLPHDTDAPLATAAADVEIVRLGIDRVQLAPAAVGKRVDLLWAETDGMAEGYFEASRAGAPWNLDRDTGDAAAAVDLELADGSPRPLPGPWEDLKSPPLDPAAGDGIEHDTYNLPTAWAAGSALEATARLSADVAGTPGGGAPSATEVRVLPPEGTRRVGEGLFVPGGVVTVRADASPVPAVGRWDWSLRWTFEVRVPGGRWLPVPGGVTTVHRLYGLVAAPFFELPAVPHRAWIEVIDTIAAWVDGATADPVEVGARIVEGVYFELGLRYDDLFGGSAYTEYLSGWQDQVFHIVAFQRRAAGSTINCSDAAGIVAAYANMIGLDIRYHILVHRTERAFDLNYIQPIGLTGFTETPFRSGGGGFSYHAVTGPPDGTIYDATLALDGDGTPTAPPHTLLLAGGLSPHDYLFALSSQWDQVVIREDDWVMLQ